MWKKLYINFFKCITYLYSKHSEKQEMVKNTKLTTLSFIFTYNKIDNLYLPAERHAEHCNIQQRCLSLTSPHT